jgi:protein-tyrosine phosphatase
VAFGPVYVHCALGHGRTATVVLAYLLATGQVATLREGLARLRTLRPGVGLHRQQAELVRRWESGNSESPAEGRASQGGQGGGPWKR